MYIAKCIRWLFVLILTSNLLTTCGFSYRKLLEESRKAQCSLSGAMLLTYYKIDCPSTNTKLNVIIGPGNRTKLKCYNNNHGFIQLIPNMTIGQIATVEIRDCPLPESMPIADITQRLGVLNYTTLVFKNQMTTNLSRYHFSQLNSLRNLTLKLDGLTQIPDNLFMDQSLKSLASLDFYSNIQELPSNIFMNLVNIDFIALGNNLRILPYDLFRYQTKLINLQLCDNKLKSLSKELFTFSITLKSINLENNHLEMLPADIFESLVDLIVLNLNGNKFISLPANLLMNNKKLIEFSLAHNQVPLTTLPSKLLADLPRLNVVTLQCHLDDVPENVFNNSTDIKMITMSYNNFKYLPDLLFASQINLKYLILAHNRLQYLPINLLENNKELAEFDVSHNRLMNFTSHLFNSCNQLEVLILNNNELTTENIAITWNFRFHRFLKTIDLHNNLMKFINKDWTVPYFLAELNLSFNNITILNDTDLKNFIIYNLQLNLTNNNIKTINLQAAEGSYDDNGQRLQIDLNNNPITCDCNLLNLVKFFKGETEGYHLMNHIQFTTNHLICSEPDQFSGKLVKHLDPRELKCEHFDLCPKPCNCSIRSYDKMFTVDCSNMNLVTVPDLPIPMKLDLNGIELNLENNHIKDLPLSKTRGYANVTKLSVAYNKLATIEQSHMPVNLTYLDLRGNFLKTLNKNTLKFINESKLLRDVYLSKNSWICDCEVARPLLRFAQTNNQLFKDFSNMTCANTVDPTYFFDMQDLCPAENKLFIVLGATTALICLAMAVYYKYQTEIKIWLYAHNMCLWFVTERELDKNKIYDAFISYSHKDEDFVIDRLVPELENGRPPFKLCVHYRDWLVGECIPDQIIKSIANSKKTIVLLSANFIASVWAKMEFKVAHQAALNEGRAKVIVIIYDDIGEITDLDSDLQAYLKMNTYLKWGDPWFWRKLRYAMPHVVLNNNDDSNLENISLQDIRKR